MADLPHWRRIIPPVRTRTPTPTIVDLTLEDSATQSTLWGHSIPKLSARFCHSVIPAYTTKDSLEPVQPVQSKRSLNEHLSRPDVEGMIDAVLCQMLVNPCGSLDTKYNSMLLQIFEAFRSIGDETTELRSKLALARNEQAFNERLIQRKTAAWEKERASYVARIQDLELGLPRGDGGLGWLIAAKGEENNRSRTSRSLPRRLECIEAQHVYTMANAPSQNEIATESAKTPPGGPNKENHVFTSSTSVRGKGFSCQKVPKIDRQAAEYNAIEHLASIVSARRRVEMDVVAARLVEFLSGESFDSAGDVCAMNEPRTATASPQQDTPPRKLSVCFHKFDSAVSQPQRRFSFEPGDDARTHIFSPRASIRRTASLATVKDTGCAYFDS